MDHFVVLILIGLGIGSLGTLIGAGGGFIVVPIMLLAFPELSPEVITAISLAVVAANAASGSVAYIRAGRVDFKAGIIFALCTIPGSVLGVYTTRIIPRGTFDIFFGILLIGLAVFLFFRKRKEKKDSSIEKKKRGWIHQHLTDKAGNTFDYSYDVRLGAVLSVGVGYFSPLLGIGGGIIHVPALSELLHFPVHLATATSHFILFIMATVSVIVHQTDGVYNDPHVLKLVMGFIIGVIPGAQLGAYLSKRITGNAIVRALAAALLLVGIRILFSAFF